MEEELTDQRGHQILFLCSICIIQSYFKFSHTERILFYGDILTDLILF